MDLQIAVQPYAEPVGLLEQKNQAKVDLSMTEDDVLIASQIPAARDVIETATGENARRNKVMVATSFDLFLDVFPIFEVATFGISAIRLPRVPLVSVTSITYVDNNGDAQTLSPSVYVADIARGRISLAYNQYWPTTRLQPNAITVRFVAGMAAPFTAALDGTITVLGRAVTAGDRVRVMNTGGALPLGLALSTDYFVIAGPKLSLTSGGAAVAITSVGTGTHFMSVDVAGFETLRSAVKGLATMWYAHRAPVEVIRGNALILPWWIEALVASQHA